MEADAQTVMVMAMVAPGQRTAISSRSAPLRSRANPRWQGAPLAGTIMAPCRTTINEAGRSHRRLVGRPRVGKA
jgi:hypothetical protein